MVLNQEMNYPHPSRVGGGLGVRANLATSYLDLAMPKILIGLEKATLSHHSLMESCERIKPSPLKDAVTPPKLLSRRC